MKKSHDQLDEFPKEQVRSAIQAGIVQAEEQINNAMILPPKKRRHSKVKKISYITAACVVLFGLFIGSTFVSPAMAEIASKIPYLNKIFEQDPIDEVIRDELKDKGYDISGIGYRVQEKIHFVTVMGSEEYYNQVRDDIKEIAEDIISSKGYNDLKFEVVKDDSANDLEDREDLYLLLDVLEEVVPKLQKQGYKILGNIGVSHNSPDARDIWLDLDIADTEERTDEIERAINESAKKQNINRYVTINFHPNNVQKWEIEKKWNSDVLPAISEGMLSRKEYKTNYVEHSYKKDTMNIIITTTIDKSDNEALELANKIEITIHEFLQSDDLKDIVGDTPYKVVVQDKYNRDIN